jgi:hypothetical protein
MSITVKLSKIQQNLKAPKGQFNSFGKYHYRNCEDILEAVKKHLGDCVLTLSDEVVLVGNRVYVKATATIADSENSLSVSAYAREADSKKGMDDSQLTGSTSSYARKYALNGLFAIDDTKDADSQDNTAAQQLTDIDKQWIAAIKADPKAAEQIKDDSYKKRIMGIVLNG